MNELGMVIDVAHATYKTVKGVVALTTDPILLTHAIIGNPYTYKRLISKKHAKLVASTGGVIGIYPHRKIASTFKRYIDKIMKAVKVVGVDHVGIGTDTDGMYIPIWQTKKEFKTGKNDDVYNKFPMIPAALLARGLSPSDVLKICGGNFMRVFEKVTS